MTKAVNRGVIEVAIRRVRMVLSNALLPLCVATNATRTVNPTLKMNDITDITLFTTNAMRLHEALISCAVSATVASPAPRIAMSYRISPVTSSTPYRSELNKVVVWNVITKIGMKTVPTSVNKVKNVKQVLLGLFSKTFSARTLTKNVEILTTDKSIDGRTVFMKVTSKWPTLFRNWAPIGWQEQR